ncbi:EthD domain-containing protein [Microbacterium sp. Au-Mic1]|uniref:EthD domain-containing protein n=1 Tax=Microbacterium sp. Au-Mic1 TaxID=2906457 RepID=UPI001E38FB2D|nr:EthD domain-containing protein [Microbacterium sp. Au-Mic1]
MVRTGPSFSDVSLRHKRVWMLRGPQDPLALRAVARDLVAQGSAVEVSLDLRSPGPLVNESEAGPGEFGALLHLYGLPVGSGPADASPLCAELGGAECSILERVVFDRRHDEGDPNGALGWIRIGTQVRQSHLDRNGFVAHWGGVHAELVRRHHPGAVRYVQSYRIWSTPGATVFDGFYESTFPTVEDWTERLFDSPRGEELLSRDAEGFLVEGGSERLWVRRERFAPDWSGLLPTL